MAATKQSIDPVLILGAGINGAALARELTLNGVGVVIVDQHDVACGATSASSRLIHGGLRYLEYREFDLVRESLGERTRLLRLAPQFVHPLRLFIPLENRTGGLLTAAKRFFGLKTRPPHAGSRSRGLVTVSAGLSLYDAYARDPSLPKRRLFRAGSPEAVPIDSQKYHWAYAFSDAQAMYPERFTIALLEDARQIAEQSGLEFRLLTYHRATLAERTANVSPVDRPQQIDFSFTPSAVINATGAWVDRTLAALKMPSPRLIGGTKGSHFLTYHAGLRDRLAGRAIYVEAADGRPVFVLSFGNGTLVGTTDIVFDDDPANAIATQEELEYLVGVVNELFADMRLSLADIEMHYCGVRPLPFVGPETPAAVTRRHVLQPNPDCPVPFLSIIGGKLTTCRSLAEETAGTILGKLGVPQSANSRERPLPGGESYPADAAALAREQKRLADRFHLPLAAIEKIWSLIGTRTESVLRESGCEGGDAEPARRPIASTAVPCGFVRWLIDHEWATTLEDLVERRLMLLYHPNLTRQALIELAEVLVECGRLANDRVPHEVETEIDRLQTRFGKRTL